MAGIGLDAFLENLLALGGRHAYAGVAHIEAQHLAQILDLDADAAFFGELDGIAHQVGDDLTQAPFISQDGLRHVWSNNNGDFHALGMAARAQKFRDAAKRSSKIHFVFVQLQHARFDLGEVQDVADQGQQRFARLGDGFRISALFGAQIGFEQEAAHAQHAFHGRADFVAHGGQEAGLGAAGLLGIVARFGQRIFQDLAVRDVAAHALHFHQATMGIAHREIFPGDPAIAVGGLHMLVIAGAVAARLQKAAEQGRAAFRMRLGREGIADRARRIDPEQFEEGIVSVGQAAGAVAAEDGVALRVHQALVARLALVEARIDGSGILERGF